MQNLRASDPIETEPHDVPEPQPPYLNMAATGETSLTPEALIAKLLDIEKRGGRERRLPKAARTIDLDVILYGDRINHDASDQRSAPSVPDPALRPGAARGDRGGLGGSGDGPHGAAVAG